MIRVLILLTSVLLLINRLSKAQPAPTVNIRGEVTLSMTTGQITGNFYLSNLPRLGKKYAILLNKGLNIYFIKDSTNHLLNYAHDYLKLNYEAIEYWLANKNDTVALPSKLNISYTGAFPIYKDSLNTFDDMGVIALNGKTFRATNQSKWYPVIYDPEQDKIYDEVIYQIKVNCPECKSIYINGSEPAEATATVFTSAKPRQLMLFAGNYNIQKFKNTTFINAELSESQASVFDQVIASIRQYYSDKLKFPLNDKITFLKHQAIEPFNAGRSWGFVNFPTFAVAGVGFKEQVDDRGLKEKGTYAFYAHELGHYYFGTLLHSNAELRWFFQESTSEYLSIKAAENFYGKSFTKTYIQKKAKLLPTKRITPLDKIKTADEISEFYRYSYAPLLFLGLEKMIGPDRTFRVLRQFIINAGQKTNYSFFKTCALQAGVRPEEWQQFENNFIQIENCPEIISKLK